MRFFTAILFIVFVSIQTANSQSCGDCRFLSLVFDSVTVETVLFGEGPNIDGDTQQLYMDIYQPFGDTMTNRPVMVFAFGGGFVQGSRDDWYVKEVGNYFAGAGYVGVAIDYRYGIDPLEILFLQHMRIFFRAMQDMRAAIQYLRADYDILGNNYKIDTANIFVGGGSAGGITALMHSYCDKPSEISEMGDISALDDLGGFYATTGFYPGYNWKAKATFNVSGALINQDWVESGDIPIISVHGDADEVVPYAYGPFGDGLLGGIFDLHGSWAVDSTARAKGVCSYLYTMEGLGHPSEDMGMDYIRSVVARMGQKIHAVYRGETFCCPMEVDAEPGDTLYYSPGDPATEVFATITNDTTNVNITWCSAVCGIAEIGSSVSVIPDSTIEFLTVVASDGHCQADDLHIVTEAVIDTSSSIFEIENGLEIKVFPTPANHQLFLNVNSDGWFDNQMKVVFYDVTGKMHLQKMLQPSMSLDVATLPAGEYLLSVLKDHHILVTKKVQICR